MEEKDRLYECSYCHNTYRRSEGFVVSTGQCASCQKWDDEKPQREREAKERKRLDDLPDINFPYVAGDPFW